MLGCACIAAVALCMDVLDSTHGCRGARANSLNLSTDFIHKENLKDFVEQGFCQF